MMAPSGVMAPSGRASNYHRSPKGFRDIAFLLTITFVTARLIHTGGWTGPGPAGAADQQFSLRQRRVRYEMKPRRLRQSLAVLAAGSMLLTLAACGGSQPSGSS